MSFGRQHPRVKQAEQGHPGPRGSQHPAALQCPHLPARQAPRPCTLEPRGDYVDAVRLIRVGSFTFFYRITRDRATPSAGDPEGRAFLRAVLGHPLTCLP